MDKLTPGQLRDLARHAVTLGNEMVRVAEGFMAEAARREAEQKPNAHKEWRETRTAMGPLSKDLCAREGLGSAAVKERMINQDEINSLLGYDPATGKFPDEAQAPQTDADDLVHRLYAADKRGSHSIGTL